MTPRRQRARFTSLTSIWLAALVVVAAACDAGSRREGQLTPPASAAVATAPAAPEALLDAIRTRLVAWPADDVMRRELDRLYAGRGGRPIWSDGSTPTGDAKTAVGILAGCADEGLAPDDYGAPALVAALAGTMDTASLATFDLSLSRGMLRYFRDLHLGRVDPTSLGFRLAWPPDDHDFVAVLNDALGRHDIEAAARAMRPAIGQYAALRAMLARYRAIAAGTALPPVADPGASVHPGEAYAGTAALRQVLAAYGDLTDDAPEVENGRLTGPLVEALRQFQQRHGLDADGVLGTRTVAALNVPVAWRQRQIELALERLRWLPDLGPGRLIAINIPMFHLWAWDGNPGTDAPVLDMAVIVGRSVRWQTPVLDRPLTQIVLRPYWNVPRSILTTEVLPAVARNPGYLARQHLEMVRGPRDEDPVVDDTPAHLEELKAGLLRLRQRPGPDNALGLVKFVLPNDEDIYLHGTPSTALFARSRRDFSHGCIRVERPADLAAWAVRGTPSWDEARLDATMSGSQTTAVRLAAPVRVIVFYTTAAVMSADGRIHFADDIYGRDATLDRVLAARR